MSQKAFLSAMGETFKKSRTPPPGTTPTMPPAEPKPPIVTMAPPPSQVAYRPSFEPFTTDQYMFPESESFNLTYVRCVDMFSAIDPSDLEKFQVDNLVFDDIKIAESMLNHSHTASSQRWWFSEFLPRIAYEWCFWFDRSVTSEEVDGRMDHLITSMLYQFHYAIVDQATRVRYSVWDLLESARAVRDRLHPSSRGLQWDDEWP